MFRLLAVGPDTIIFLIVVAFSAIGSIIKMVKGEKEEPRKNLPRRPRNTQVQKEIDEFLQQQSGRRGRAQEAAPGDIEIVDSPPTRRQPSPSRPTKANRPQQRPPAKPTPPGVPPASKKLSERREPGSPAHLGDSLRQHVSSVMGERVASQVQRDLPHLSSTVDQQVQQDLGTFSVSSSDRSSRAAAQTTEWVQLLRNPVAARQAVLMSEILGRPKALRK